MSGRATHGHTRGRTTTPEFRSWCAMRQRCFNENGVKYPRYGGRGITVCDRWLGEDGFANFLADMGPRPSPGYSVDRIDNDGDYEPGNCRWATYRQQARNRGGKPNHNMEKTHCPQGHPYAGENLRVTKNGDRKCKACDRERAQRARDRDAVEGRR